MLIACAHMKKINKHSLKTNYKKYWKDQLMRIETKNYNKKILEDYKIIDSAMMSMASNELLKLKLKNRNHHKHIDNTLSVIHIFHKQQ